MLLMCQFVFFVPLPCASLSLNKRARQLERRKLERLLIRKLNGLHFLCIRYNLDYRYDQGHSISELSAHLIFAGRFVHLFRTS